MRMGVVSARSRNRPLALLEGLLGAHALGHVLGMTEDAGRHAGSVVEHVAVEPDPIAALLGEEAHPARVHPVGADAFEVRIELVFHGG